MELGHGHYVAGLMQFQKGQFYNADKELRAALPLIQDNKPMLGSALFSLGVANFQLGKTMMNRARVLEAATFSEQAAAIPGEHAQQAGHNSLAMKKEARTMR